MGSSLILPGMRHKLSIASILCPRLPSILSLGDVFIHFVDIQIFTFSLGEWSDPLQHGALPKTPFIRLLPHPTIICSGKHPPTIATISPTLYKVPAGIIPHLCKFLAVTSFRLLQDGDGSIHRRQLRFSLLFQTIITSPSLRTLALTH